MAHTVILGLLTICFSFTYGQYGSSHRDENDGLPQPPSFDSLFSRRLFSSPSSSSSYNRGHQDVINAPLPLPMKSRRISSSDTRHQSQRRGSRSNNENNFGESEFPVEETPSSLRDLDLFGTGNRNGPDGVLRRFSRTGEYSRPSSYGPIKKYNLPSQYSTTGIDPKGIFDVQRAFTLSSGKFGKDVRQQGVQSGGEFRTEPLYGASPQIDSASFYELPVSSSFDNLDSKNTATGHGEYLNGMANGQSEYSHRDFPPSGNHGVAPGGYTGSRPSDNSKLSYINQQHEHMRSNVFSSEPTGGQLHQNSKRSFGFDDKSSYGNSEMFGNTSPYGSPSGKMSPFDTQMEGNYNHYDNRDTMRFDDIPLNDYDGGASSTMDPQSQGDYKSGRDIEQTSYRPYWRPAPQPQNSAGYYRYNPPSNHPSQYYPQQRSEYQNHYNHDNRGERSLRPRYGQTDIHSPRGRHYQQEHSSRTYHEDPRTHEKAYRRRYDNERYTPHQYYSEDSPYNGQRYRYQTNPYSRPQGRRGYDHVEEKTYEDNERTYQHRPLSYSYTSAPSGRYQQDSQPRYGYGPRRYNPSYGQKSYSRSTGTVPLEYGASEYGREQYGEAQSRYDLSNKHNTGANVEASSYEHPIRGTDYAFRPALSYPEEKQIQDKMEDVQNDYSFREPYTMNFDRRILRKATQGRWPKKYLTDRNPPLQKRRNGPPILGFGTFVKNELESLVMAEVPDAGFV